MSKEKKIIAAYTSLITVIGIIDLFIDLVFIQKPLEYLIMGIFIAITFYIVKIQREIERSFDVLIIILIIFSVLFNSNIIIKLSGVIIGAITFKKMKLISKRVVIGFILILVPIIIMIGVVKDTIGVKTIGKYSSPNNEYVIEQILVDTGATGSNIKIMLQRNIANIAWVRYRLMILDKPVEILWKNGESFYIDKKLIEVD